MDMLDAVEPDLDPDAEPVDMPPIDPMMMLMAVMEAENVAEMLDDEELARIGDEAVKDYRLDRASMKPWLDRMKRGIELASLVKEEKTYPWKNAANVKYPLITTAALQFNARAYPAIVPSEGIVKAKVLGSDPQGTKVARGQRVAAHMSWQLLTQVEEWEEETDKLLVQLPIVGTMVRKVWYDPTVGRPRSRLIGAGCFIVNDKIKALGDAPRMSEEIALYPAEIESRKRAGTFRAIAYNDGEEEDRQAAEDFIEQHTRLDLDRDGYDEPYIVTAHVSTGRVARIVADFDETSVVGGPDGVISIARNSYFVPYHFLPSLDGGFFGTGLGLLLGDISDTINTIINMQLDAGHMASLGGGFIGSEFRIKGGSQVFKPGEWKLANTKGAEVRSSIVPLTFPGPDATLFQLLGLLIDAGREVASVKDIMTGDDGGKNMTATTTLALIEQGMMVFTASYKRIFRALKAEFRLFAKINAQTVTDEAYNAFHDHIDKTTGQPAFLNPREEYAAADMDIVPVADPNSVTKMQEAAKAQIVMQMAEQGLVDKGEATKRILSASSVGDVEALMPKPDPMAEQAAQMQAHMMQLQAKMAEGEATLMMAKIEQAAADIAKTQAETAKVMAEAQAEGDEVRLDAERVRLDEMKLRLEAMRDGLAAIVRKGPGGVAGQPRDGVRPGGLEGAPGGPA